MNVDDGQFFDNQNSTRDEELDAALEVLKRLSQSTVAAEVGITERRYREIERGRVAKPHKSTREAIIRFADTVQTGDWPGPGETSSKPREPSAPVEQGEGGFPYGAAAVVLFFLICVFAPIFVGQTPGTLTLPILPISPSEE